MSIQDNDKSHYSVSTTGGTAKMAGIRTYTNWSDVCTMPSCIIYIKHISGKQYDFESQGSSLYKLSGKKLYATLTPQGDGSYIATGTYDGMTVSLSEWHTSERDESWLDIKDNSSKYWIPVPVNTSDNYLGIKPDVNFIDEVVWVVGDEAILRSDIEMMRMQAVQEGMKWDGDPDCRIPEQLAVQKLFLNQAALDR